MNNKKNRLLLAAGIISIASVIIGVALHHKYNTAPVTFKIGYGERECEVIDSSKWPQWIPNKAKTYVLSKIPDHKYIILECYDRKGRLVEGIRKAYFADDIGGAAKEAAIDYAIGALNIFIPKEYEYDRKSQGYVSGGVKDESRLGTEKIRDVSREKYYLVKKRIYEYKGNRYHILKYNCRAWYDEMNI